MTKKCPVCQTEITTSSASCPQCGFRFMGSTQAFEPIAIDGEMEGGDASYVFRVVRGPQVGTVYKLEQDRFSIGRNPASDIFLNDMTVSRQHAHLEKHGGDYIVFDDDSYNGVWVNNKNVESKTLKLGDIVQIGKFAFIFDETN